MDKRLKKLPIGIENFSEIQEENFYYVDKTGLIIELLENWGKVNLITRPRRFGKSLNMNMLKSFFEINNAKEELFHGLKISKDTEICKKYMGKYPIISLSLKDVNGRDYDSAYNSLCMIISDEARIIYRTYDLSEDKNLLESERILLEEMLTRTYKDESQLAYSLKFLSQILYMQCGKKVIILIDEYDVPLDKAYQNGYYEQMLGTLRGLLSQTLKSNESLYFSVLTGCLRISKESIFTGLNNFKVLSISDDELSEYFGFTDYEVREMLQYYALEDKYEAIKEWYDGYHFGSTELYCPWDVINYINKLRRNSDAKPEPYWINSSSNSIIQDLLTDATQSTKDELEKLISGEIIEKIIIQEMTYKDLDTQVAEQRENYLWSVLYITGYLTDVGKNGSGLSRLKIPNREIREIFTEKIRRKRNF